ncbi:MAG: hypothetical protein QM831_22080 [Kofleriaceae bacterium]
MTTWLIQKLEELKPGDEPRDGYALGTMVDQIGARAGMVSGMVLSNNYDRDKVVARGAEIMAMWVPQLSAHTLRMYSEVAQRQHLALDVSAYLATADARDAELAAAEEAKRVASVAAFEEERARIFAGEANPALEAALADDTPQAFDVYADWLESKGMARGELIHLMLRNEGHRTSAGYEAIEEFIEEHADELLGEVPDEEVATLEWRRGFIDALTLDSDEDFDSALERILCHPSARRLRSLTVGMNGESAAEQSSFVNTLIKWHPDHLRTLFIGSFDGEISWYQVGDVSAIWQGLPSLREVTIRGGAFELGEIQAPALESLTLQTGGLTSANVASVADAAWPNLKYLDLYFGEHSYGDTELDDVRTLLENKFPALRHLGIANCPFVDQAVGLIAESPLAAQLEELNVSLGCFGEEGAAILLGDAFPKLKKIDISRSFVGEEQLTQLRARYEVVATDMNSPDEDRYVSISE